jgi:hypothetical protein
MPFGLEIADAEFVDQRKTSSTSSQTVHERRQFADSYDELSPDAEQLARAIDGYKLRHRRRFITYDEMLTVIKSLGYKLADDAKSTVAHFVDRRGGETAAGSPGRERRQFVHQADAPPEVAALGMAIDGYKLRHRRRVISYEETLGVLKSLGYQK